MIPWESSEERPLPYDGEWITEGWMYSLGRLTPRSHTLDSGNGGASSLSGKWGSASKTGVPKSIVCKKTFIFNSALVFGQISEKCDILPFHPLFHLHLACNNNPQVLDILLNFNQ